jgi:hypothetical protein
MRSLHHPSSRLPPGIVFHTLRFFPSCPNMGDEVKLPEQPTHFIEVVSLVEAHTLWFLLGRPRSFDGDTFDRLFRHLEIVTVRSIDGNADWDTVPFREHAPFGSLFGAVSGIRPSFFPLPAALSPSPRPLNRSASRCLSTHRIVQGISSRAF